jgi:hypothetical protein
MKRVIVVAVGLFAMSVLAANAADASKIHGYISDSMCGAKHAGTGAECVKKCIAGGLKPVFVDDKQKAVWTIDNPDAVKDYYGSHVVVTAHADETAKSVHIDAIEAAR